MPPKRSTFSLTLLFLCLSLSFSIAQTNIIAVAGTVQNFNVSTGDTYFDPSDGTTGGPGGACVGIAFDPGDYPACNCTTTTTLCATDTLVVTFREFGMYSSFNLDWIKIYDGSGTASPVLFDNSEFGAQSDIHSFEYLEIVGESGCLTFETFFSSFGVSNNCGWEADICVGGDCVTEKAVVLITDDSANAPDASAILDLNSKTGGLLLPRMSSGQRSLIPNPTSGLMVYDTDEKAVYFRDDYFWTPIGERVWDLSLAGDAVFRDGKVSIGTFNALSDLHIQGTNSIDNGRDGVTMSIINSENSRLAGIRLISGGYDLEENGSGIFHYDDKLHFSVFDGISDTVSVKHAKLILERDLTTFKRGLSSSNALNINLDDESSSNDYDVNLKMGNSKNSGFQSAIYSSKDFGEQYLSFAITESGEVDAGDWKQKIISNGVLIQGLESNGSTGALSIGALGNSRKMILDDNEIDVTNGSLYLQGNSDNNVSIGTLNTLLSTRLFVDGNENDGVAAVLRLRSGTQTMMFDGNEMDTYSSGVGLYLNNNSSEDVHLVTGGGLVGINEDAPSAMLHIKQRGSSQEGLAIENDGDNDVWAFEIGLNNLDVYFNGVRKAIIDDLDGSWDQQSDRRLKKDISYLSTPILDKVLQLKPAEYRYLDNSAESPLSIGFIAQEVQALFPSLVKNNEDKYLSLSYSDFSILSIKAIQEQQQIIEDLKHENQNLKKEIKDIWEYIKKE